MKYERHSEIRLSTVVTCRQFPTFRQLPVSASGESLGHGSAGSLAQADWKCREAEGPEKIPNAGMHTPASSRPSGTFLRCVLYSFSAEQSSKFPQ